MGYKHNNIDATNSFKLKLYLSSIKRKKIGKARTEKLIHSILKSDNSYNLFIMFLEYVTKNNIKYTSGPRALGNLNYVLFFKYQNAEGRKEFPDVLKKTREFVLGMELYDYYVAYRPFAKSGSYYYIANSMSNYLNPLIFLGFLEKTLQVKEEKEKNKK